VLNEKAVEQVSTYKFLGYNLPVNHNHSNDFNMKLMFSICAAQLNDVRK
jgi:hypothetical protein